MIYNNAFFFFFFFFGIHWCGWDLVVSGCICLGDKDVVC